MTNILIPLYIMVHFAVLFFNFCMGVKLGRSNRGRNVG